MASRGTRFTKLNDGWNAEPGAPHPEIRIEGQVLVLTFYLNPWVFPEVKVGDVGELRFDGCWRYRLGPTNDEGWWRYAVGGEPDVRTGELLSDCRAGSAP